jgi:hypothetical protein
MTFTIGATSQTQLASPACHSVSVNDYRIGMLKSKETTTQVFQKARGK